MKEADSIQTETGQAGDVPRLALVNDIAGFGRCSTTVALPIISLMGVQACPVPTSILSNHLGFPLHYLDDYTPHMREYFEIWHRLDLSFDGLYCGFLSNVKQASIVEEFLALFHPAMFLLDPCLGDHGKLYSTITDEHCRKLKKLAARAHILTPNLTEACLLTDTDYRESWSDRELELLCGKLCQLCPNAKIVITGIVRKGNFLNLIIDHSAKGAHPISACIRPRAGAPRPGTGDIFASILAADALYKRDFGASVKKAAYFVALCIQTSEKAGIPVQEGVIFERCLKELLLP